MSPRRLTRTALSFLALGALVVGRVPDAAAGPREDKRACAEASEDAQLRRIHGKLRGAREELLVCARDVCPVLVKHDCDQWLAEVEASLPTIVISALDRQGKDAGDVRVTVDGEAFLQKLDGSAVAIDPGEHMMRFERTGDPPIDQKIIVREGVKNRQVSVRFGPAVAITPVRPPVPLVPVAPVTESRSPALPILSYSLLAVGAAAIGVGVYFEVKQLNDYDSLKNGCSLTGSCMQSQVDSISNERIYAGVLLGTGIAAAAVGTIVLVTRPKHKGAEQTDTKTSFQVMPRPGGGSASFALSF